MPPVPTNFPYAVPGDFALTAEEAAWLQERILTSVPDSLLALLVRTASEDLAGGDGPWEACRQLPKPASIRSILDHSELFSLASQGAALLYNIMVAQRFEDAGFSHPTNNVDPASYLERFHNWYGEIEATTNRIAQWDLPNFWHTVRSWNPQISYGSVAFISQWLDAVRTGAVKSAPDDPELRRLIQNREVVKKGRLARLASDDQLSRWNGESATGRLYYRWGTVQVILNDIETGLQNAGA